MQLLKDQTAVVTGAAQGIGAAVAQKLAEHGARVVIADVDNRQGTALAQAINDAGGTALFTPCNVAKLDHIDAMVSQVMAQFGRIDILVNNAGVTRKIPLLDLSPEDWDWMQDINTRGLFFCMQRVARAMKTQGAGVIINMASIAGKGAKATSNASYAASKAAAIVMSRVAANELGRFGIRVNAVCPGATRTPLLDQLEKDNPSGFQQMLNDTALGRFATPENIADTVLFLSSPWATSITGQSINVDNGLMWD